jgi:hypothetical protein
MTNYLGAIKSGTSIGASFREFPVEPRSADQLAEKLKRIGLGGL